MCIRDRTREDQIRPHDTRQDYMTLDQTTPNNQTRPHRDWLIGQTLPRAQRTQTEWTMIRPWSHKNGPNKMKHAKSVIQVNLIPVRLQSNSNQLQFYSLCFTSLFDYLFFIFDREGLSPHTLLFYICPYWSFDLQNPILLRATSDILVCFCRTVGVGVR